MVGMMLSSLVLREPMALYRLLTDGWKTISGISMTDLSRGCGKPASCDRMDVTSRFVASELDGISSIFSNRTSRKGPKKIGMAALVSHSKWLW